MLTHLGNYFNSNSYNLGYNSGENSMPFSATANRPAGGSVLEILYSAS